ncbi:M23 family metallopeptidase [Conexibacter sp. SYSU D00693]|uniref:M23 family metallopeptidase n=1 Tax=Conexibacter sp. SYSU D00693 TaxID=2812560 RepID=UPI00196ABCE3|nr:M23 family metallopeptidase [Conexibacter sp. SYSU D00693]
MAVAVLLGGPAASLAYAGGAAAPSGSGGAEFGALLAKRPVARAFSVAPRRVVSGKALPTVRLRVEQTGARTVRARIVLWPTHGGKVLRVDAGRVRVGRAVTLRWPRGTMLAIGTYTVRLHVKGEGGQTLQRTTRASGRAALTVVAPPRAAVQPPAPATPAAPPSPGAADGGVFPVQGPFTYGEGLGVDRGDHRHEGQDLAAAEGTPVVSPLPATVTTVDYQAGGAGHYVVVTQATGRAFFFAHCKSGSVAVRRGAVVAAGTPLCQVGSTGRSTGPHLHFEVWPLGWKQGKPADPLPLLRAWE